MIPSYLNQPTRESNFYVVSFVRDLMKGDIEQCLLRTRSFFSSIPYDLENNQEKHYQTIFYLLFCLMGQYVDVEVKNAIAYEIDHRKVVKIGVNFDSTTRTLGQWKIK